MLGYVYATKISSAHEKYSSDSFLPYVRNIFYLISCCLIVNFNDCIVSVKTGFIWHHVFACALIDKLFFFNFLCVSLIGQWELSRYHALALVRNTIKHINAHAYVCLVYDVAGHMTFYMFIQLKIRYLHNIYTADHDFFFLLKVVPDNNMLFHTRCISNLVFR